MQPTTTNVSLTDALYSLLPQSEQELGEIGRTIALWNGLQPDQISYRAVQERLDMLVSSNLAQCKAYIGIHSVPERWYRLTEQGLVSQQMWLQKRRPGYFDDDNYVGINWLRKT